MDICEACGSAGTFVWHESGMVCSACGIAAAMPSFEADAFGDRRPRAQKVDSMSTYPPVLTLLTPDE